MAFRIRIAALVFGALGTVLGFLSPAMAQTDPRPSACAAIAQSLPGVTYASFDPAGVPAIQASVNTYEVRITFVTHSTYLIESAGGVSIATDYAGYAGQTVPRVVTMNRAHSTHYTDYPDPAIEYVLRGWDPEGGKARHYVVVDDVLVRNVTTDIVRGGLRLPDTNSIFIFEIAGLCIGHLGHLHHALTDGHFAQIGRLDVVMVPIDGGLTLSLDGMAEIIDRLRSSVILPMHARGWATPADFIALLGDKVDHKFLDGRTVTLSLNSLPSRPTVMVPRGL
ncbi:MAG: MBL fold metallo-hydrolase [Pseudomonadota bacterium]